MFIEKIEKLVSVQKTLDARLSEIQWYLNLENNNLSDTKQYQYEQRLKEILENLVEGLFSDLSQTDTKVKAVYSLYLDLLKEVNNYPEYLLPNP